MSEETTQDQNGARSFEERVFARFDALDARLTALEEKVEARLRETRPIWEAMQADLHRLNGNVEQIVIDLHQTRAAQTALERRVSLLESRPQ